MLSGIAAAVAVLAFAGAMASWIAGAVFYARTFEPRGGVHPGRWLAAAAWPFTLGRLHGVASEQAAKANRALVAFFACLMVAIAATSVATNLHRLAR